MYRALAKLWSSKLVTMVFGHQNELAWTNERAAKPKFSTQTRPILVKGAKVWLGILWNI